MKVAVIPARGGSKRIPRKNIREFQGRPIIAWSILAARAANVFDRVIVSTDDAEIAAVAAKWGAEVPFLRPLEIADDNSGTTSVIAHATHRLMAENPEIEAVCCIYATAPLISALDIQRGLQGLESGEWAYAFSATDFAAPVHRSFRLRPEGGVEMLFPEHFSSRSQDLPQVFHDAAQFYWGRPASWMEKKIVFADHSLPILIPRWRVQDIDTPEDWERAELAFNWTQTAAEENSPLNMQPMTDILPE